ncbi:tripartite tricarboxylate transporter substrate binding protein [Bradyrhizobium sp. LHD-71]|uniref:Bug family tripartite tricarboxylate transporter substrate binding protein n=1 Tax=Bradyrhizobium sp. LHD-71 TaxID=3072141 RepID=UPI0028108238|nr:tripartite tricarboxylate transporter substrate binding protein [Bradyrhizobium sp. LHD-71]MDQ8727395.1 tripartite tricarboxylate transporter substrate binding protein [Bradyrhizobium sp. LHD-71]
MCVLLPAITAIVLVTSLTASFAQDYPNKPIRLVVPYPPGSGTDIVGRLLAQQLKENLGQTVYVDNRPGAGATIGTASVAKAEPDGYTILMADLGPLAIAPHFYRQLPYDPVKELAPIGQVAVLPFLLAVHPSVPAHNVSELIALAKAKPGKLDYASVGNGTAVHLATELFKQLAGIDIVHVPYKGSAPALTDLVAGRISMMFVNVLSAGGFLASGQLRALAIGTAERSPAIPKIPTVAESTLPEFRAGVWFGLLAPAGTPRPIIEKLSAAAGQVLRMPEFKAKLAEQGAEASSSNPEEFSAYIQAEIAKWADVIKTSGVPKE